LQSTPKPKPVAPVAKPTFKQLIAEQSGTGFWNTSVESVLTKFLGSLPTKPAEYDQQVWATLLSLYVLSEAFEEKEDEWKLLAQKAKTWLKQQGIAKPD
jgi:hypothetical protein